MLILVSKTVRFFRSDFSAAFGVFFPIGTIGGTALSVGPEVGLSVPWGIFVAPVLLRVPVRAALNIAFTDRVSLDVLLGTPY